MMRISWSQSANRPARPRRWPRALALLLAVSAVVAGWVITVHSGGVDPSPGIEQAPGPSGPLRQLAGTSACVKSAEAPNWTSCASRLRAMKDPRSIVITRDGRFAYAASSLGSTVVSFARDRATGALRQLFGTSGCATNRLHPDASGCSTADGIKGALGLALSPDDHNLYVAGIDGWSVAAFSRDASTGALTQLSGSGACIKDPPAKQTSCPAVGRGLHGARWVTVSPDGKNVYVTSPAGDDIAAFARDADSGALTQLSGDDACIEYVRSQQPSGCPRTAEGLDEPRTFTLSPDGRNGYAASDQNSSVAAFSRDPVTGGLTQLAGNGACVKDSAQGGMSKCPVSGEGLNFAFWVSVSPDGKNVYVASNAGDAIASFTRDPTTGALTQLPGADACLENVTAGKLSDCARTARGLDGAGAISISPDGRYLYVASFFGNTVAAFARDVATGSLRQLADGAACLWDPGAPSNPATTKAPGSRCPSAAKGLEGPRAVTLSPDGHSAYVPSSVGGDIAQFTRLPSGALVAKRTGR